MAGPAPHAHPPHAVAARPTLSILRWSAGQRVLAVAVVLAALWSIILATIA